MSGVAHQTHDVAWGEECLAADAFAPFDDDRPEPAAADAADESLVPVEAEAAAGAAPLSPSIDSDPGACEPAPQSTPEEDDPPPDTSRDEAAEPLPIADAPAPKDLPRLPRVAENEFLPGGACALPAIRVVPPPLALDPDARPVPDAPSAPPRPRRRRRLAAWTCACLAVVAAEIGAGLWDKQPPEILVRDVAVASGIHPDDFVRIAEIESRLDPKAFNRLSKASGLFQLLPGTAKQYKVADSFDARANAEAAARLFKHNAGRLRKALGREPTAWELYLAHQQGATGAIKLLKNPDKKAIEVVGRLPVLWNRGTEEMTARQFAAMWREAFNNKGRPAAVN